MFRIILSIIISIHFIYGSNLNLAPSPPLNKYDSYQSSVVYTELQYQEEYSKARGNDQLYNNRNNREDMNIVGGWGNGHDGWPNAIIGFNDTIIYDSGDSIIIADYTDPSNPVFLDGLNVGGRNSWGYPLINGDYLFYPLYDKGFKIFDISDANNVEEIGFFAPENNDNIFYINYNIVISGDTAFASFRDLGIKIVDISDLTNPVEIASYVTGDKIDAVAQKDGYAIIGDRSGIIRVLDFTNSEVPEIIGEYQSDHWVRGLHVEGNYLHAIHYNPSKYRVYDITDLSNIELVSEYDDFITSHSYMHVSGEQTYFSSNGGALEVIGTSDPLNPVLLTNFEFYNIEEMAGTVMGNRAYWADKRGILVFDITDINSIINLAFNEVGDGMASALHVQNTTLYFYDEWNNIFRIYNATDPSNLIEYSTIESIDNFTYGVSSRYKDKIAANDNTLFISVQDQQEGWVGSDILVYDVLDLSNPYEVTTYESDYMLYKMDADDNYLYLGGFDYTSRQYSLEIVDISESSNLIQLSNLTFDGGTAEPSYFKNIDFFIENNLLYMMRTIDNGEENRFISFLVLDISDLENPSIIGELENIIPWSLESPLEMGRNYQSNKVYITNGSFGIEELNVLNPSNPIWEVTHFENEGYNIRDLKISPDGTVMYFFGYIEGNQISAREMASGSLLEIASYPLNYFSDLKLNNDYVFVSRDMKGISIFNKVFQSGAFILLDQNIIDFGSLYNGDEQLVTVNISNPSDSETLEISNIYTNGEEFSIGDGLTSLNIEPGADHNIQIYCTPQNSEFGDHFGELIIESNAVNAPIVNISLAVFVDVREEPFLTAITDVQEDQGGQVRISFYPSKYDGIDNTTDESFEIQSYSVWRVLENNDWDAIGSFNALQADIYHYVAPTLCDSTADSGICWSKYVVTAHTSIADHYYVSQPDSGYSVDNIAPAVPSGFMISLSDNSLELSWSAVPDEDFQYYIIDKSADALFETDQYGSFHTTELSIIDPDYYAGNIVYYRLAAVDYAGNRGGYTVTISTSVLSLENEITPSTFALHQNYPNPFNPTTTLQYDLPNDEYVSITIYDMLGNVISDIVNSDQNSGYKSIQWNATNNQGQPVSAGVYLYSIEAGDFRQTKKMILLK